jgi:hypothetical protein
MLSIVKSFHQNGGATRGASACAARATSTNRQLSIFDLQFFFFGSGLSGLGSGINDHPVLRTGRIGFLRPSGEKQKHFSASNAARATGCNASGLFGKQ